MTALRWSVPMGLTLALIAVGPCEASDVSANESNHRFYATVDVGWLDAEDDFGLLEDASFSLLLSGAFGHRLGWHAWGEIELGFAGRDHEVQPGVFPAGTDDPTLSIAWLSYSIVGRFPVGKVEPFIGVGIGSGQADLTDAPDEPFTPPELEIAEDRGLLLLYRVGIDAPIGPRNRLGVELRKVDFEADLGVYTSGETDVGGNAVLFTYRHLFGW